MKKHEARSRVVIENISPQVEGGKFPIKRIVGEVVCVTADLIADGHDVISARLIYRKQGTKKWSENHMLITEDDAWKGEFRVEETVPYEYAVTAWVDHAMTWYKGFQKKLAAGDELSIDLRIGAEFLKEIASLKKGAENGAVWDLLSKLESDKYTMAVEAASSESMLHVIENFPLKHFASTSASYLVQVDRLKAAFSNWYEFFPRSSSPEINRPGTFNDCLPIISRLAQLGFDTVYFPPVHPVGVSHRKGKNNSTTALSGEPGSPWAIGASEGGHTAINPTLGTLEEFKNLISHAQSLNVEIAMDLAYQCSPDHPWVKEHPSWFKWRPDGTVQYAENPPKKYQDVLPIHFETDDWENLWKALKDVIEFWIEKGIRIFRVDNPHTKPFVFWEWIMAEMRRDHPDVLFLSEAFTRPKIMARLAKIGFHQSYSYFTWRKNKSELIEYLNQLTQTELREYFRANFWPNTPDILPEYLQNTGPNHTAMRFVLAATLSSNYGMYGPVYEYCVNQPVSGKEEYFDSEKYEVRHWDWRLESTMHDLIGKINEIRNQNPAFHSTFNILFCETDNEMLLSYYKSTDDGSNKILVIVNLDPINKQSGWVKLPINEMNVNEGELVGLTDLMDQSNYRWNETWNYVELEPQLTPCHIFKLTVNPSN
jgi:starch synthase (maltosyl-transferring)